MHNKYFANKYNYASVIAIVALVEMVNILDE
jgi:hypothetical protein